MELITGAGRFDTRYIHAGEAPDRTPGAHGVPLYQNVTFVFATYSQVEAMRNGDRPHFTSSPRGNPTVRCLELKIADLEGTEASIALNSDMAAISGAFLTLLVNGGLVVASDQLYAPQRERVAIGRHPGHPPRCRPRPPFRDFLRSRTRARGIDGRRGH
jgi:cystathionine beta-lyase/cystathionine gamma-synthase